MDIITTTGALAAAIDRLSRAPFVALDTEFMRDQTYWPKLCLVQAASEDTALIIDPLAPGLDLAPLWALLTKPDVLKVFHAARQDIEIFVHLAKIMPNPVFDTQIAAMVCGFGESVSYETLVRRTAQAQIDKSSRFTDWSRRPLSEKQLTYALGDVTHLVTAYKVLAADLAAQGRAHWVAEEMAALIDPAGYTLEPEEAWRRLRTRSTSKRFVSVLMDVAAWREREAQARDVPRGRIMKDEALVEVAAQAPKSAADLDQLRAVPRGFAQSRAAAGLLAAVQQGLARPLSAVPAIERPEPVPDGAGALLDLLRVLLKARAEQHGVAPRLVASAADLERLTVEAEPAIPALDGWRRDVFGAAALELKRGRLALAAVGGQVQLVPLAGPGAT